MIAWSDIWPEDSHNCSKPKAKGHYGCPKVNTLIKTLLNSLTSMSWFIFQILDVRPEDIIELLEGTRICAYWSQQFSCLYPGTVSKGRFKLYQLPYGFETP